MKQVSKGILRARWLIVALFIVALLASTYASTLVHVNYKLSDYLPEKSNSTVGLRIMDEEFASKPSNLRILLYDVSVAEALEYKEKIASVEYVKDVQWLDDAENIYSPIESMPKETVDAWYKDGNALITAYIDELRGAQILDAIREIIGPDNAMAGDAVQTRETQDLINADIAKIMCLAVPIVLGILMLSTTSYFEPILFLLTIGVAIMLGKGTDLIFGTISFITGACSAILQLAISMDYAIFLLEAFEERRRQGQEIMEAMASAMTDSFTAVLSSALTTVMGFVVMVFMEFSIGYDLGLALAKDIGLSLICVLVLLPCLTVICNKAIEKTKHRPLMPSFQRTGRIGAKLCIPVMLVIALLFIIPGYLGSQSNAYIYGTNQLITDPESSIVQEQRALEEMYARANQMVVLVPGGNMSKESMLAADLDKIPEITSVISYSSKASNVIPVEYLSEGLISPLIGEHYDRLILTADIEEESDRAFRLVEQIRNLSDSYFPGDAYLTGGSAVIYDMRNVVRADDVVVNKMAILCIGAVLLLNFKSLFLPFLLLAVIKSSIYINLSVPYFFGVPIFYISSLIINTIQLGATVDYAILLTTKYMENRKTLHPFQAAAATITQSTSSILTSASILFTGGMTLGMLSSVEIVGQIGVLVGRGAFISAFMVLIGLPALLMLFDPLIRILTFRCGFCKKQKSK